MAAGSLTGVFAAGAPALPERLRTLVLVPSRFVAPGETIRAEFTFSNLGGAAATGARVRFSLPPGASHVAESDAIDDRPLGIDETFVDLNGAAVGDLEPGSQHRVVSTFRIGDTIEDGTELFVQAALATDQTQPIGSNVERIVVRSKPDLRGSDTVLTIISPVQPKPGDVISVRATIANSGQSSAHDVVAMLPVPQHTAYVARSARVGGRALPEGDGEPFDYDRAQVVAERVAPGQSVIVEYQAAIDSPLPDGTRINATGVIAARECGEFAVSSAEIVVASPVDFDNGETALVILTDDVVIPGQRVPIVVRAANTGTGIAQNVTVAFTLPPGLAFTNGSAHVDGQPVADDVVGAGIFAIGNLGAGRIVEVGCDATVAVPTGGDPALAVDALLRWRGGERRFGRRLSVRTMSRFVRARNFVEAESGVAQSREDVRFLVHVYNDGTAPERPIRLRLLPGPYLEHVRIAEGDGEMALHDLTVDLGVVLPHVARTFVVTARIASPVPDRTAVTLGAMLEHGTGKVDLGSATVIARSRSHVDATRLAWEFVGGEPMRPNRTAEVVVRFTNSGSDVLRDAKLTLALPSELAIDRAIDARRERDGLMLGDVPAETSREARIIVRLLRAVPHNAPLEIEGWLHGRGIGALQLPPLAIPTFAKPLFSASATLRSTPGETIEPNERVSYELLVRNDGDGPAERLLARVVPTNLAVYVPGTTTINGVSVPDDAGMSQLWSQRGLMLADVLPGIALRMTWEMMAMSPLPATALLETRAVLEWDGGETLALAAPALRVLAHPSLSETSAGMPLSVATLFAPPPAAAALTQEPEAHAAPPLEAPTPAALPAPEVSVPPPAVAPVAQIVTVVEPEPAAPPVVVEPTLYADFSADALTKTLRTLERTDAGGVVQHLFALRFLMPTALAGASPDQAARFSESVRAARAPIERFFVRLRLPRLAVTAKDLEDRDARVAMLDLAQLAVDAVPGMLAPPASGTVRLIGPVASGELRALIAQMDAAAPLGSVTPWLLNAHLLGTRVVRDGVGSDALDTYRRTALEVFGVLADLPIDEFHRVLSTSGNRSLDEALAAVFEELRAAAQVVAE